MELCKKDRQKALLNKLGIFLKMNETYQFLDYDKIVGLTAASNYTTFYFNYTHNIYISSKTLLTFARQLPGELFWRVHRSHLVNQLFIKTIGNSTNQFLSLKNIEKTPIARRKYSWLINFIC